MHFPGGGSSSSAALVATAPISVDSSSTDTDEYSAGFITGDELLTAHGLESNIASIFVEFIVCICFLHVMILDILTGPSETESHDEEVLFYGPPTLAEHRAVLFMNRFLQPELPPDVGADEPSDQPPAEPHPNPSVEAPPAAAEGS